MKPSVKVQKYHTYAGHKDCLYALEMIDDQRFVSAGADGMVVLWDLQDFENGKVIARISSSCYALCYHRNEDLLLIGQNFQGLHLINVEDSKGVASLRLNDAAIFDIQRDGDEVFVATGTGEVFHIYLPELKIIRRFKDSQKSARSIALTDEFVMVGYSDNCIRVYNRNLQLISEFEAHTVSVFTLQADLSRGLLVSGSRDAHIKAWELGTFELKHDVVAHMYAINHISYSRDGQHFVSCSMDKSVKIWDAESLQLRKVIDKGRHAGHGTSVNKTLWMPYHDLLVTCSDDRSIAVWKIKIGDK